jgi:ornithine decarboxylase
MNKPSNLTAMPRTIASQGAPLAACTPYVQLDLSRIRANVDGLRAAFAALGPTLYYAVKANPDAQVLALVRDMGCGFDVASIHEIRTLQALGVPGSAITFSSPVKIPSHIEEAYARGVNRFAFDNPTEVRKLGLLAPGAQVVLRLEVPHEGSCWPLAGKFGVPQSEAALLLEQARDAGLQPYGLTFHVGSQCLRPESWLDAIAICSRVWREAQDRGIALRLLNLGGGLPARYTEDVPSAARIGELASWAALQAFGPDIEYAFEPGRSLVADAGTLVTSVIGNAERNGKRWVYVDQSIYAGLLEVTGGWSYTIRTPRDHSPKRVVTLAGPSCDSTDILAQDIELPDLEVGDRLELLTAGAYTTSYENYNGLAFPSVVYLAEEAQRVAWEQAA